MLRKRPRIGSSPQMEGRRFEHWFAKLFGVTPVKGSGNQWWAKLDVKDVRFLFQCKDTKHASFSISRALMREIENALRGEDRIPVIATAVENSEVFVTLRAEDFIRLIQSDKALYLVPSKGEQKRLRSRTPALLRED